MVRPNDKCVKCQTENKDCLWNLFESVIEQDFLWDIISDAHFEPFLEKYLRERYKKHIEYYKRLKEKMST